MIVAIFAAVALAQATPAEPAKAAPSRGDDAAGQKPAKAEQRCTTETVTGSRVKRRVCRTPEQEEQAIAAARTLNDRNQEHVDENGRILPGL